MRIHLPCAAILILCAGCQPLLFPMVKRLSPEQQQEYDQCWNNMLTPVDRLDRQTLLDCMILYGFYQTGVDELRMKSVKKTSQGQVEMTIDFDKARPKADRFTIRVIGPWGRVLRSETWTGEEVLAATTIDPRTGQPVEYTPEREQEMARRMLNVTAATQPAMR